VNLFLRICALMIANGWLGAMLLFAFVIAPTAFRVLPGAEVAGQMIGPVLRAIHLIGIAAGLSLALLAWALGRRRWLIVLPLLLAAAFAFSEFFVTAQIAGVLPHDLGGPGPEERAARFAALHRLSMIIYTVVGLGAAAVGAGHVHADRSGPGRWG
jgi:hypothetical protein